MEIFVQVLKFSQISKNKLYFHETDWFENEHL